jgi:hypothetical protein
MSNCEEGDEELREALAVLISSTRSKKRPLPLTDIAEWLQVALGKLGSYSAVADRIGLSSKMLRQFSYVKRLSAPVQELFQNRKLDSVDAAAHLAMLPLNEQYVIAKALAENDIDTSDIRAVIQLRKAGLPGRISSLLKRVKETRSKQEYVAQFVVRGTQKHASILKAFKKHIPASSIIRLELTGSLGRLVLTERGKQALEKAARFYGVPLKRVIPIILQDLKES